jgi:hypothetical protein
VTGQHYPDLLSLSPTGSGTIHDIRINVYELCPCMLVVYTDFAELISEGQDEPECEVWFNDDLFTSTHDSKLKRDDCIISNVVMWFRIVNQQECAVRLD